MTRFSDKASLLINEIKKRDTKSIFVLFFDMLNIISRLGLSPGEYFAYGLHSRKNTAKKVFEYLPSSHHYQIHLKILNREGWEVLFDKLLFKELMDKSGIKTPYTLGYTGPSTREDISFHKIDKNTIRIFLSKKSINTFLVKPAKGNQGQGIFVVNYDPESDRPFSINGVDLETSDFFNFISEHVADIKKDYIIFEELLENTNELNSISPTACASVRINTLRTPDNKIHATMSSARLGRRGSVTSNGTSGGLNASIDLNTGIITACKTNIYISGRYIKDHPDTDKPIVGFEFPHWHSVLELCTKAAACLSGINSVGWDVAVTKNGAVILEANHDWDIISEQIFGHGYLSENTRALLAEYNINFPNKALPKPSLKKLKLGVFRLK